MDAYDNVFKHGASCTINNEKGVKNINEFGLVKHSAKYLLDCHEKKTPMKTLSSSRNISHTQFTLPFMPFPFN
jgi:hypothetical protein